MILEQTPYQNNAVALEIIDILLGHKGVEHGAIPVELRLVLRRQYQGKGAVR
jgi:hypothetical protein